MIQLVILGLAAITLLAGVSTLAKGKLSLTGSTTLTGGAARGAALALIALALAMAGFALFVLPHMK